MVEINVRFVPNPSISALTERFNEVADAQNIERDEALRQALVEWIKSVGGSVMSQTIVTTEKEFKLIRAALEVLREGSGIS